MKTSWTVNENKQLYIGTRHIQLPYDVYHVRGGEPKVYQYEDKLVVVLSTSEQNGVFLPKEKRPQRGDKAVACNAYCLDAEGNVMWRNEALRKVNFCIEFGIRKGVPTLYFDHDQYCSVDMETGKLLREPYHPPAPVW